MSSPDPAVLARLREIVGAENVLTSPEDTIPYGFDGTAALKGPVGVVVHPGSTQEISEVVKLAAARALIALEARQSADVLMKHALADGWDLAQLIEPALAR